MKRTAVLLLLLVSIFLTGAHIFAQEAVEIPNVPAEAEETIEASEETEISATESPSDADETSDETENETEEPEPQPTIEVDPAEQKQADLAVGTAVAKVSPLALSESDLTVAENYTSLEEVVHLQSGNPYRPDTLRLIRFSISGAKRLSVRFESDFSLEPGYDIFGIYVFDATVNAYRLVENKTYSGSDLAGQTVVVDSDSIVFRFETDGDIELSGWRAASVEAEMPEEAAEEPSDVTEPEPTNGPTEEPTAAAEVELTEEPPAEVYPSFYITEAFQIYGEESDPENADKFSSEVPTITGMREEPGFNSHAGKTQAALKFSWTPVADADGYRVWFSTTSPNSGYQYAYNFDPKVNSVTFFTANPEPTYYFRVAALNNGTFEKLSVPASGQFGVEKSAAPLDSRNIARPTLHQPTNAGDKKVRLTWTAVPGATGYRIWRSETSASGGYGWIVTIGNVTGTVTSIPSATKTYYFKVAAIVGNQVGPVSGPKSYREFSSAPTLNPITRVSNNQLRLTWTAVPGATGYRIWRSETSPSGGYGWIVTIGNVTGTVTTVPSNKTYYFKVAAMSGSTVGAVSAPQAGTTAIGKPTLTVTNADAGKVRLSWTAVPGATGYRIWRSDTSPSSGYGWTVNVGNTTTTVSSYPNEWNDPKTFYYRVAALSGNTVGPLSDPKALRLPIPAVNILSHEHNINSGPDTLINWRSHPSATGYRVYISFASEHGYSLFKAVGKDTTELLIPPAVNQNDQNRFRYIKVVAMNGDTMGVWNEVPYMLYGIPVLTAVVGNPNPGEKDITLDWKHLIDENNEPTYPTHYTIYQRSAKHPNYVILDELSGFATGTILHSQILDLNEDWYEFKIAAVFGLVERWSSPVRVNFK